METLSASSFLYPFIPIDSNVMNKSIMGDDDALPAYTLPTFSITVLLGDTIIAPPTGTRKFLSVEQTIPSTLPIKKS